MKIIAVKIAVLQALVLAAASPAMAQSTQGSARHESSVPAPASSTLNLKLPASENLPGAHDPPGKYYGDTGGKDADGSSTTVHGSVSTMVGYAKGYGNMNATGVDLDIDHRTASGNHVRLRIDMSQGNGFPGYGYYGYGPRSWRPLPPPPSASSSGD
jgi:hypothetical protein